MRTKRCGFGNDDREQCGAKEGGRTGGESEQRTYVRRRAAEFDAAVKISSCELRRKGPSRHAHLPASAAGPGAGDVDERMLLGGDDERAESKICCRALFEDETRLACVFATRRGE